MKSRANTGSELRVQEVDNPTAHLKSHIDHGKQPNFTIIKYDEMYKYMPTKQPSQFNLFAETQSSNINIQE